ncbi:hypothetical protein BDP27DRAFT_1320988 [Rhodocollybia butyracea]|uniref:Uncharacterized protein n=1 Tax=Rhodocollybia butyracea TaxID=206335 RepID=A0A9P5UAI3_9AGAR|nr:hypothetical protein BDP27DRAFT_1320988 [Rhodocollybia butyracea]
MTPEEVTELSNVGLVLFQNSFQAILMLILSGIYCLAFCIGLYLYWKNTAATVAKKALICVLLGTFVLMLLRLVCYMAPGLKLVKYGLVVTLPGGIMEQIVVADTQSQVTVYVFISTWSTNIIIAITDAVIVWRAWAIWVDNMKVRWTLLLVMLADIDYQNSSITLDWVNFILSLSVNIIATCLISFQAWLHHKSIESISITRKRTKGERTLLLLVESGAIYALLQLLTIITSALSAKAPSVSPIYITTLLTTQFYTAAAALNPVAIFILVQTQNTYEQSFHLEQISSLSQQAQSQQVSVVLSGPEDTPADVAFADREINMTHSA